MPNILEICSTKDIHIFRHLAILLNVFKIFPTLVFKSFNCLQNAVTAFLQTVRQHPLWLCGNNSFIIHLVYLQLWCFFVVFLYTPQPLYNTNAGIQSRHNHVVFRQKCIDYIEKLSLMVIFLYNLYIFESHHLWYPKPCYNGQCYKEVCL